MAFLTMLIWMLIDLNLLLPLLALTFAFRIHVVVADGQFVAQLRSEVAPSMFSVGRCGCLAGRVRAASGR